MRRLLIPLIAALALSVPSSGLAATAAVKITANGFSPKNLTVTYGDVVTWTNADKVNHQVVANNGSFASGVLKPGQSYTFTTKTAGKYNYHDALKPSLTGSLTIKGPPPTVTLGVATPILIYGEQTTISGTVSNGKAGEIVLVNSQSYGASVQQVASLTTTTNGSFSYTIAPTLYTTYSVKWKGVSSQTITVQVRPKLTLAKFGARLYARTMATSSFAGRHVYLQKHSQFGQWVTVGKMTLGPQGGKIFSVAHVKGTTYYRVYMSTNQAGLGYLESWSNAVAVHYSK